MRRVARAAWRAGLPIAFAAAAGCDTMRTSDDRVTLTGPAIGARLVAKGGSAITGVVFFQRRAGGVTMVVQVHNAHMGAYRVAIHATGNCSSPNAFSAGPLWAPPGRAVEAWGGNTNNAGTLMMTVRIDGIFVDGPDGVLGKSVVVHRGALGPLDAEPGRRNERVACGVIGDIASLEL
jgi:Cu-Zn family superoxide dismutase